MNAPLSVVDVLPLEGAAFAAAHSGCNNELEVRFIEDASGFQRADELFHGLIVCDFLFLLLTGVFVGAPSRVVIQIAALHRVGEDAAQTAVDTFYRCFGKRLSVGFIFLLAQLCIQAAEMFGAQINEFIAAEVWFEALNVLFFPDERGFCQLVCCNRLKPDFRVLLQRDRPVNVRIQLLAAHLEQHRLLL